MTENGGLSTNQRKALVALMASKSVRAAAKKCGLAERTLYRYLADPAFAAELARQEGHMIDAGVRWMITELEAALGTIDDVRTDESASPSVRLRAASTWLAALRDLRELRDIEARLARLEEVLHERFIKPTG
jgi:hypothetical protein